MPSTTLNKVVKPPDGGYGWVVLFAAFVISMICDGVLYAFGAIMNYLHKYFKCSYRSVSSIGSVANGVYLLSSPIAAKFINRFGCRTVTFYGGIIASIAMIISIFAPNPTFMVFSYGILGGFGFSLIYLPAMVAVSLYFDTKLSIALGMTTAGSGIGTILFSPLSNFLYQEYGWKGGMLIMSAIILNCCAFGLLLRPLQTARVPPKSKESIGAAGDNKEETGNNSTIDIVEDLEIAKPEDAATKKKSLKLEMRKFMSSIANFSLLQDTRILMVCFANVLSMIGYYIPYVFLSSFALECGVSDKNAAFLISIIGISNTISRMISGFIPKFCGISSLMVNNIGLILSALVTFFIKFYRTFPLLAAYAALFGLFIAPHISLTPVFLENMVGKKRVGEAISLIFFSEE